MIVPTLTREVDVNFFCPHSYGHMIINNQDGRPLCTNTNSWWAKGRLVTRTQIVVDRNGYCSGCGYIGQARIPDKYDGATVIVKG